MVSGRTNAKIVISAAKNTNCGVDCWRTSGSKLASDDSMGPLSATSRNQAESFEPCASADIGAFEDGQHSNANGALVAPHALWTIHRWHRPHPFALRPPLRYEYHHIAFLSIKGGRPMKRSFTRIAMMTAIAVAAADVTSSASFAQGGPGYQQGPGYYVPPPRRDRDRDSDRGDRSLGAKVAQGECKSGAESFIRVVGGARITQNGAKNSADSAWRS